jgi:hypothetical protein
MNIGNPHPCFANPQGIVQGVWHIEGVRLLSRGLESHTQWVKILPCHG